MLQIHPAGLRTVRADKRISQFTPPGKGIIHKCAVNSNQVAIALMDNSIIYFELDAVGQLQERAKPDMGGGVIGALDLVSACILIPYLTLPSPYRTLAVSSARSTW